MILACAESVHIIANLNPGQFFLVRLHTLPQRLVILLFFNHNKSILVQHLVDMKSFLQGKTRWSKIMILAIAVIACSILQLWIIACVALYLIVQEVKFSLEDFNLRYLKQNLFRRDKQKKQFVIKDSLQYLKSCRMIYFGYDYRSNTNVILQQEKEIQQSYILSPEEEQVYQKIYQIYQQTVQLIKKIQQALNIEGICYRQIKTKIDSFENIFTANKLFQAVFVRQNYLLDMAEDTIDSVVISPTLQQKLKKLVKLVPHIKKRQQSLKKLQDINIDIFSRGIKEEYKQYYNFFLDKNDFQRSQSVKKWIDSLKDTIEMKESKQQEDKKPSFFYDDTNHTSESEIILTHPTVQPREENITAKKAQFLKKLDTILIIGIMRRRQQEEEKKTRLSNENQSKID